MTLQLGANTTIAIKLESVYNTAPGDTGATFLRHNDSPGLNLQMAEIKSGERRVDLLDTMARMGSRSAPGSFTTEAIVGAHDIPLEAAMRGTWAAATPITVDAGAALTSFTVNSTSTFTLAGTTTPIAAGLRVGDTVRFTNMSDALNNGKNVRIKSIAGGVVTVHGTPLTVQGADSAATLTILKKLSNPAAPVRRTFWVEERDVDIDASVLFGGVRFIGFKLTGSPDGMAMLEFPMLGGGLPTIVTTGSSPYFTSPTLPAGSPLTFADAVISLGGSDVVNLTAFELNYSITAATLPVIGSPNSPDVFDNKATLSGTISGARADLSRLAAYIAETEYELQVLLVEPESEPKDGMSFYVPRIKLTGVQSTIGGDGAKIETLPFTCGVKDGFSSTGFDQTLLTILSSAA